MDDLITEDLKQILSKIVGQQATIQAIAIVKVFCATQGQQFEYANITGILCLIWDRERKAPFFRIFNPETFVLIFESEIYIDFADYYKKVNDQFYYFELVRGFIGFSFAFPEQAEILNQKIKSISPTKKTLQNMDSNDYSQQQIQKEGKKKELFGFRRGLKKLYKKIHDKKEEETEEQCDKNQKFYLSKPILQNTKNEIKLTETGTLDLSKMDENMKKILQNAGITEQEMNDKEFAPFICDALSVFNENISSFIDQEKQQEIDKKQQQQVQESDQNQTQISQQNDIKLESQNINGQQQKHQDSGNASQQSEKDNQRNVINNEQQKLEENTQDNLQNQQSIEKINNQNSTQNQNLQNQNQGQNNETNQSTKVNISQPPPLSLILNQNKQKSSNNNNVNETIPKINETENKLKETLNNQIKQSAININERNNLLHQIRAGNFNLRKAQPAVEKKKTLTQNIEIINQKNNQQNLTNYLAQAILQRRNQLKKHYTGTSSEQESSDSEFSD